MRRFALLVVALVLVVVTGCGGSSPPYKSAPRPALPPSETAPGCGTTTNHALGQCLPRPAPSSGRRLAPSQTLQGCDLSNNDPVYGAGSWRAISARMSWCYLKVSEGTGFVDSTASAMAAQAKAAGLPVGGYDFQHICQVSPVSEADLFVSRLRADGLLGRGTLVPMADAEYGNHSCNARAWEDSWRAEVIKLTGISPGEYTGAWFADPEFGCWWPAPYRGHAVLAWISGYTGSLGSVSRPCGHSVLDVWQYTDHGFNGAINSDLSAWVAGTASLQAAITGAPAPPPDVRHTSWYVTNVVHHGRSERQLVLSFRTALPQAAKRPAYVRGLERDLLWFAWRLGRIGHCGSPAWGGPCRWDTKHRPPLHQGWRAVHLNLGARGHAI